MWKSLIPLVVSLMANGGYLCVIDQGWKFAKAAGLN